MALSEKHELFVREYMVDLNATQAAIRSGYSEKTAKQQGSRLLTNVAIRTRIEELQGMRAEKLELDADWVLQRLMAISDRCMKAEPVMIWDREERAMVESGEYMFDSNGANKAVELIGKHLSMFKDKLEVTQEMNIVVNRKRMNANDGS